MVVDWRFLVVARCLFGFSGVFWRRSGTKRAKNGRGESSIVVGRIDVVGVVEVETERSSV